LYFEFSALRFAGRQPDEFWHSLARAGFPFDFPAFLHPFFPQHCCARSGSGSAGVAAEAMRLNCVASERPRSRDQKHETFGPGCHG